MRKTAYLIFVFAVVALTAQVCCHAMCPSLGSKLIMATTWTTSTNIGSTDLSPPTTALNKVGYEVQITAAATANDFGDAAQNQIQTVNVNTNSASVLNITGLAYADARPGAKSALLYRTLV